ncbi:Probable rhamnogalacturonate lyase C [Durusdinium trenchii]
MVAISDTHLLHENLPLPEGDLLVHAGDLSYEESRSKDASDCLEKLKDFESDFSAFLRWFRSSHLGFAASMRWLGSVSKFEHRVLVGGNHDYILEKLGPERAQMLCEDFGVKYLHTEAAPLSLSFPSGRKVKIWGSGVSFFAALGKDRAVISGNIAYQLDTATEEDKFVKETAHVKPGSVNVLITHGPPAGALYGKGDQPKWINDLLKRVKPQVYLCGHAHNPEKVKLEQKVADVEGTLGAHIASTSVWNAYMGLPFICDLPEWK